MWREIWLKMAGGKIVEYNTIKGMDVIEFWPLYDIWKMEIQKNKNNKKTK